MIVLVVAVLQITKWSLLKDFTKISKGQVEETNWQYLKALHHLLNFILQYDSMISGSGPSSHLVNPVAVQSN